MGTLDNISKEEYEKLKKEMLEQMKDKMRNRETTKSSNDIKSVPNELESIKEKDHEKIKPNKKPIVLLTASSNCGTGLWTSICVFFASIFGVESKNYTKKMEKTTKRIKDSLLEQAIKYPDYEFEDFKIIKEGKLKYSGSLLGVLKETNSL